MINLAGTMDMSVNIGNMEKACQAPVVHDMLGGAPADVPNRYAESSVFKLLPIGLPQVLLWGEHEEFVPHVLAQAQVDAATKAGDQAALLVVPGVGHFEIATTQEPSWPVLRGDPLAAGRENADALTPRPRRLRSRARLRAIASVIRKEARSSRRQGPVSGAFRSRGAGPLQHSRLRRCGLPSWRPQVPDASSSAGRSSKTPLLMARSKSTKAGNDASASNGSDVNGNAAFHLDTRGSEQRASSEITASVGESGA